MSVNPNSNQVGRVRPAVGQVTIIILVITVFVYILQEMTRAGILRDAFLSLNQLIMGPTDYQLMARWIDDPLVMLGGKVTGLILRGEFWRFLTPALLHSSLMHIGFNMYALYFIGTSVESYYGWKRYLALYVIGAFGGVVLSFLLSPNSLSVGASGAVFALIGAEAVFVLRNRAILGDQARSLLMNSLFIIAINLFLGLTNPSIDNWGHIGGLLAGMAFGWLGGPLLAWEYTTYGNRLGDTRTLQESAIAWLVVAASFGVLVYLGFAYLLV